MTEMLLGTDLDLTQRQYIEVIRRSGDALMHLVEDVLDFSKLEAGKLTLDPFDFDPRGVLEDAVAMVSTAAARKNLKIVRARHYSSGVIPALIRECSSMGVRARVALGTSTPRALARATWWSCS